MSLGSINSNEKITDIDSNSAIPIIASPSPTFIFQGQTFDEAIFPVIRRINVKIIYNA